MQARDPLAPAGGHAAARRRRGAAATARWLPARDPRVAVRRRFGFVGTRGSRRLVFRPRDAELDASLLADPRASIHVSFRDTHDV